ncbi:MAG: DNA polymerase IV [Pseudogulbenkiania sp.]|nr:DNA polymerase IV [Pseudogulbenkiania sp.]
MAPPQRKIIHVDCDCFFAAVEMRDQPAWRNLPLAVGGQPDSRGVIATCNYLARRYGVHSAMSSARALHLCPSLLIVPPDFARYKAASQQILAIYHDFTELVEPLSLDEAYLDVSGQPHCRGSASLMAETIRRRIRDEVGITASAGIAPNKFLAKVASDWNKPDGQFVIRPQDVDDFVRVLAVEKIPGVGAVTAARLHALGIERCEQLQPRELAELVRHFGRFGERLHALARGIDPRPVSIERQRKSLSVEETYPVDLPDLAACQAKLPELLARLAHRLERAGRPAFRGLSVKIKFADFSQTTVEQSGQELNADTMAALLRVGHARGAQPVRLLGVGVRMAGEHAEPMQLALFGADEPDC